MVKRRIVYCDEEFGSGDSIRFERNWIAQLILLAVTASPLLAEETNDTLDDYVLSRIQEFDQIGIERHKQLTAVAEFIQKRVDDGERIQLTFICTHNSRRSHMTQLWSTVAAQHYGIENYQSFSGGTEATAFNPRAVEALKRAGMDIRMLSSQVNPCYVVSFSGNAKPQLCFSKVYHTQPNPTDDFCAVMVCSDADKNCPIVQGATARFSIPYDDPKIADNTSSEEAKYDERSAQIAREMLYLFSKVK